MTPRHNLKNIRRLLVEGFSDEELRQLVFDVPDFRSVFYQLAWNTGKAQIVQQLLEYADQKELIEILLDQAREHNLAKYQKYQPYYNINIYGESQRVEFPDQGGLKHPPHRLKKVSSTQTSFRGLWVLAGVLTGLLVVGLIGLLVVNILRKQILIPLPEIIPGLAPTQPIIEVTATINTSLMTTPTLPPVVTPEPTATPILPTTVVPPQPNPQDFLQPTLPLGIEQNNN